jgi:hypothetical protein
VKPSNALLRHDEEKGSHISICLARPHNGSTILHGQSHRCWPSRSDLHQDYRRLVEIRNAPTELGELINEISDLQPILTHLYLDIQTRSNDSPELESATKYLDRIKAKLLEVSYLVQYNLVYHKNDGMVPSKLGWLRDGGKLKKLRDGLAKARTDLLVGLLIFNFALSCRVQSKIDQIVLGQDASVQRMT